MKEYRCAYRGRVKGGFLVVFRAENGHKLRIKSHRRGEHYDFVRRGTCYFVDRKEDVWQVA